jgi:hypothetical protein
MATPYQPPDDSQPGLVQAGAQNPRGFNYQYGQELYQTQGDLEAQRAAYGAEYSKSAEASRKVLEDAAAKLQNVPTGPSADEERYLKGAAFFGPGDFSSANPVGSVARGEATQANILGQRRAAQEQRIQDLAKLGIEANQYPMAQSAAMMNNATQQLQKLRGQIISANTGAARGMPWYVDMMRTEKGATNFQIANGAEPILAQIDTNKLYGQIKEAKQPDGSSKFYWGATLVGTNPAPPRAPMSGVAPGAQPGTQPVTQPGAQPQAQPGAQPGTQPGVQPQAAQKPPEPGMGPGAQLYRQAWTAPLSRNAMPLPWMPAAASPTYAHVYETVADQAFANIRPVQLAPQMSAMGQSTANMNAYKQDNELADKMNDKNKPLVDTVRANLNNATDMLSLVNSGQMDTGKLSQISLQLRQQLASMGAISDKAVTDDTIFDKEARQLASSGLKSIYGARVTNMELDQQLKSLPNLAMNPRALQALLRLEILRDVADLHKDAMWDEYRTQHGSAQNFDNWYNKYFSPYSNSMVNQNIQDFNKARAVVQAGVRHVAAQRGQQQQQQPQQQAPVGQPPGATPALTGVQNEASKAAANIADLHARVKAFLAPQPVPQQ